MDFNIDLLNKEIQEYHKLSNKTLFFPDFHSVWKEYSFFTKNGIDIQELLKEITFYSYYFHCFQQYTLADFPEKKDLEPKYVIFKYLCVKKTYFNDYLVISDDIFNNVGLKKKFIQKLILSFEYLLNSIIELNKKRICYFQWSTENIYFNDKDQPILENFDNCLKYQDFSINLLKFHKHQPLEVFILYYMKNHDCETLSLSILEEIYKNITFFPISYQDFISLYQPFTNLPKKKIFMKLISFIETWDSYGICSIYLEHVEKIIIHSPFDTKFHFLPKWRSLLKKNISNNPFMREKLHVIHEQFQQILSTF
jgi:hypothetical protein